MSILDALQTAPCEIWNHAKIARIDDLEAAEERNDTEFERDREQGNVKRKRIY